MQPAQLIRHEGPDEPAADAPAPDRAAVGDPGDRAARHARIRLSQVDRSRVPALALRPRWSSLAKKHLITIHLIGEVAEMAVLKEDE